MSPQLRGVPIMVGIEMEQNLLLSVNFVNN